jgi:hypothetical protein
MRGGASPGKAGYCATYLPGRRAEAPRRAGRGTTDPIPNDPARNKHLHGQRRRAPKPDGRGLPTTPALRPGGFRVPDLSGARLEGAAAPTRHGRCDDPAGSLWKLLMSRWTDSAPCPKSPSRRSRVSARQRMSAALGADLQTVAGETAERARAQAFALPWLRFPGPNAHSESGVVHLPSAALRRCGPQRWLVRKEGLEPSRGLPTGT